MGVFRPVSPVPYLRPAFIPRGSVGGNTAGLGVSAQSAATALDVSNVPPAITLALGASAVASTVAMAATNTPPAVTAALGASAQSASTAFAATNTPPAITCSFAAASVSPTVDFQVGNSPPAGATTLAVAALSPSVAFAVSNVPPAATSVLAAASAAASTAFAVTNAQPGNPAVLASSAASASTAFAVLASTPATLGASAGSASTAFALAMAQPVAMAPASGVASTAFAVLAIGGTSNLVELDTAAEESVTSFVVVVAPVANPNLKQAVVAALKASAEIAGIVGTRIYPDGPPATAQLPSLCYTYQDADHVSNLSGAAGMVEYRMRFECRSLIQADNEAIALYVRTLFQGKIGYISGLRVLFVCSEQELDRYIPPLAGSDNGTHYKRFDMRFKVRESVPFTYTAN